DDLVPAVAIDVADAQVVVALSAVRPVARRSVVAVERPEAGQLPPPPVSRDEDPPGVIAPTHDTAGELALAVCDRPPVSVDASAVVIPPIGDPSPRRSVIDRGQCLAGRPPERREILGPFEDIARGVAVIGSGVADGRALAVDRPIRRLADDLGPAVAVEVV